MASVQQQAPVVQNEKHNAAVEEMTKEAQSLLTKSINDGAVKRQQVGITAGSMLNYAKVSMKLDQKHDFDGNFLVEPSRNIDRGHPGVFVHQGQSLETTIGNSKGAVVYSEYLRPGEVHVGFLQSYLLAWKVSRPMFAPTDNQVYVEAGPVGKFNNVDWAEIDRKLEASSYKSEYLDHTSKAYAAATIDPPKGSGTGTLGAVFTELIG